MSSVHCLNCGYDVGIAGNPTCPECGAAVSETVADIVTARRSLDGRLGAEIRRHLVAWTGVIGIYAVGAGVIGRSLGAAALAFGLILGCVLAGLAVGTLAAFASPSWHRRYVMVAWARALWWMQAPWLAVSAGAIVLLGVGLVDASSGLDGALVSWITLAGFAAWTLLCFVFLFRSFEQCFDTLGRWWPPAVCRARRDLVGCLLGAGVFLVFLAAVGLGIAGGTFSMNVALRIVDTGILNMLP